MKKLIKVLVWLVAILVIIGGFLSLNVKGKPRDLGVRYAEKDYQNVIKKSQLTKDKAPQSGSVKDYKYVWSGKVNVGTTYTQEEITAWLNENRPSYFAFKNVQVKINNDGTIEAGANVDFKALSNYALTEDEKKYVPSFIPDSAPVYAKGVIYVQNNQVHIEPQSVVVGFIPVPSNLLKRENISYVENKIESLIPTIPNLYIETLKVENGKLIYKGTGPKSLTRIKNP
ncbi:hypothetical protein [Caldisericum exile]|uniref:Uncharacterized protein n=1 Tax=Caldisericum exile (strain DSM 21853 / NBRC 104410 / AZM16c01) TaxID=511051 RepID=A0A7U6GF31_CALEA|nr:hypothetical protein [Caldisericum exile]BAL81227.1 hypothetical protein CSE_11010 [Caldisericum exile AZM16c01]